MVAGARQSFQFLRQNKWLLGAELFLNSGIGFCID